MLMVHPSAAAATASIFTQKSSLSLAHEANIRANVFHILNPVLDQNPGNHLCSLITPKESKHEKQAMIRLQ